MNLRQMPRTQVPPLPPSPLTEVPPPTPPDVPLPWSTLPPGAAAGLIVGAAYWVVVRATAGGPHLPAWVAAYEGGVGAASALLMALGAAIFDRVAPTWPRAARWACGMGAAALAGVGVTVSVASILAPAGAVISGFDIVGACGATGASYALFGGVLGFVGGSGRSLLWRLPLAGCAAMGAMVGLRWGLVSLLGVRVLVVGPAAGVLGPVLGLLMGFVMAERLYAAHRRAMDDSRTAGEAAS